MYVSVKQLGGFLGLDRTVEFRDGGVVVTEQGVTRGTAALDEADRQHLHELVNKVIKAGAEVDRRPGSVPSDALETVIEVVEGAEHRVLKVQSGDQAPDVVWELIQVIGKYSSL